MNKKIPRINILGIFYMYIYIFKSNLLEKIGYT